LSADSSCSKLLATPRQPLVSKFNRLFELARAERQLRNLEQEESALKTLDYGMALRRRDLERRIAFFGSIPITRSINE
jgi:hypothetical protein